MPILLILRAAILLGLMLAAEGRAADSVPVVYQDEYVTIHSGVAEIGRSAIHLGDTLSFVIELEFNADRVRIEALNEDFFLRAFANKESISLYGPPLVTFDKSRERHVLMRASWPFQILGCPDGLPSCRGDKHYALPVIAVSYQIIGQTGEIANDKSVRFRPRPGSIAVASALAGPPGPAGDFLDYFPGGAHPELLPVESRRTGGIAVIFTGILLLVVGFNNRSSAHAQSPRTVHSHVPANRWERALASLTSDAMPDDQWTDLLRRCASWYCLDELDRNPHSSALTEFDQFFADVSEQESIGADRRSEYLSRFERLISGVGS